MRKTLSILFAVTLVVLLTVPLFASGDKTINGWVTDSKCGVKGANANAAECTKKCLASGANMVVVSDGDQKVLMVENPEALKGHEGHHMAVTGSVTGDKIHVDSVKML